MKAMDTESCKKAFSRLPGAYTIYEDRQICVGGEKGKDSCTDDSGTGLTTKVKHAGKIEHYKLVGLVSWGHSLCAMEGFPGVYTKVAFFLKWILDNLCEYIFYEYSK